MVEELESEVTDLISKISTGQTLSSVSDTKKIDELTKNLKEEKEQREKLANEKKKVDEQLAKLEAEAKKGIGNDSAGNISGDVDEIYTSKTFFLPTFLNQRTNCCVKNAKN